MNNWYGLQDNNDKVSVQGNEKTNTQRFFDEVGRLYKKHNNDYNIEYTPENRNKLIEMNLKGVIKIAKGYLGNGLSLDELISAGNEGLVRAYEKYNPTRSKFAAQLIEKINAMDGKVPHEWVVENVLPACQYGEPAKSYKKVFDGNNRRVEYDKEWLKTWITKTIKNASFNSIAMMWVSAFIRQEIQNNGRMIRKPATEIKKEKTGESPKERIIDINQPISDDGNTTMADTLFMPDDTETDLEVDDRYEYLHDTISKLFTGIKLRDRRIVMKRYGIGYIRPLQPKEISEMEHISVARVSQIINIAMNKMRENAEELGLDKDELYGLFEHDAC